MLRVIILTFSFLLLINSCLKKKFSNIQIIGHAASGLNNSKSPFANNTLEAVQFALAFDECAGVELDVQMSKDGVLYCYHDTNLETKTKLKGCIPQMESSSLENIRYNFPSNSKLLKLSDLNQTDWRGKSVYFDLRLYDNCSQSSINIPKMIQGFKNTGLLSNSKVRAIFALSSLSDVSVFDSLNCKVFLECYTFKDALNVLDFSSIQGIILRNKLVSKEQIALLKQKKEVMLYEVRAAKPTRLALRKNPNYLMTDDLETAINEKY